MNFGHYGTTDRDGSQTERRRSPLEECGARMKDRVSFDVGPAEASLEPISAATAAPIALQQPEQLST